MSGQTKVNAARLRRRGRPSRRVRALDDHYISIGARLQANHRNGVRCELQTIGVVSCSHGEGASSVAANLAITYARSFGKRVLVVDAHTEQPSMHTVFGVSHAPGLAEILRDAVSPMDCVQTTHVEQLRVLPTGQARPHAACDVHGFASLVDGVKDHFDQIIIDLPPATELSSVFGLVGLLDGVLLVVESERTRVDLAQSAKERLIDANANLVGVIFNKQQSVLPRWLHRRR